MRIRLVEKLVRLVTSMALVSLAGRCHMVGVLLMMVEERSDWSGWEIVQAMRVVESFVLPRVR